MRGQGDRISSAADPAFLQAAESDAPFADHNYGHSWSFTPKARAAVYGRTEAFPPSPIDHLAKGRFLRVPFRRVPVIDVNSIKDLADFVSKIVSADESILLRWRGQNKEFYLKRSEEELLRFFGDTKVLEPSLVPSAARSKLEFSKIFPSWAAILDLFISERAKSLSFGRELVPALADFRSGYRYRLWAFATAQHYGLPSVGLDVTTNLWTAVLFALHEFKFDPSTNRTSFKRIDESAEPVLYAMAGFSHDLFEDKELAPLPLQGERPKAQTAHFFGTGWGIAANRSAERIFIAFRLLNHSTWCLPKRVDQLFPKPNEDPLCAFLLNARTAFPQIAEEARLANIYYV